MTNRPGAPTVQPRSRPPVRIAETRSSLRSMNLCRLRNGRFQRRCVTPPAASSITSDTWLGVVSTVGLHLRTLRISLFPVGGRTLAPNPDGVVGFGGLARCTYAATSNRAHGTRFALKSGAASNRPYIRCYTGHEVMDSCGPARLVVTNRTVC